MDFSRTSTAWLVRQHDLLKKWLDHHIAKYGYGRGCDHEGLQRELDGIRHELKMRGSGGKK